MIEKNVPIESAVIIHVEDGKVLTVRHKAPSTAGEGVTGFPGGQPKDGESLTQAAKRELFEETARIADEADLIGYTGNKYSAILNFNGAGVREGNMTAFICNKAEGEVKENYKGDPQWIPVRDFERGLYETPPNVLEAFEDAKRSGKLDLTVAKAKPI